MTVMRYVDRLLLGVWVGALLCFGAVVAPALFAELSPPAAGAVVRRVISVFDRYGVIAGVVLLALSRWQGDRVRGRRIARVALLAGMTALAGVSLAVISPRMAELRARAGDGISALAADDPVRREFGRLHGVSSALLAGQLVLGLAAFAFPLARREPS